MLGARGDTVVLASMLISNMCCCVKLRFNCKVTNEGFSAYHENNRHRYRRAPQNTWSRWINGANSYGYHYSGMDDDAFEEGIGWMAYAYVVERHARTMRRGPHDHGRV